MAAQQLVKTGRASMALGRSSSSKSAPAAPTPTTMPLRALPLPRRRSSSSRVHAFAAAAPSQQQQPLPRAIRTIARAAFDPADPAAAGQVSAALMASMEQKIRAALEAESVRVADVHGDGRHVAIDVVSSAFEGKGSVARQRLVYKAIWEELQETVHAVDAMTTRTPAEAAAGGGQ